MEEGAEHALVESGKLCFHRRMSDTHTTHKPVGQTWGNCFFRFPILMPGIHPSQKRSQGEEIVTIKDPRPRSEAGGL